jgi:hypothetical protein
MSTERSVSQGEIEAGRRLSQSLRNFAAVQFMADTVLAVEGVVSPVIVGLIGVTTVSTSIASYRQGKRVASMERSLNEVPVSPDAKSPVDKIDSSSDVY